MEIKEDNTLLDLHNSSDDTKADFNNCLLLKLSLLQLQLLSLSSLISFKFVFVCLRSGRILVNFVQFRFVERIGKCQERLRRR